MTFVQAPPRRGSWVRRVRALSFVGAMLLALPSLNSPLLQDDVIHRLMLLDRAANVHWSPLELYDFVGAPSRPAALLRDEGLLPWFTGDDLALRFFRPLSSAVLAADAYLFDERVWASRLHSLAWFMAVLALASALHARFLSPPTAALATVIYAVAVGHVMPIGWIAARHALICTAFSLATVWLHLRARADGWSPGRWLSWIVFPLGLLAGELTLGTLPLIAAWEALSRRDPVRRTLAALLPFAFVTLIYVMYYVAMGYGVRGSGGYVSLDDGAGAAVAVPRHFLVLLGELVAATPSDAVGAASIRAQAFAAAWGVLATAIVGAAFVRSRRYANPRDAAAMWWFSAAAAAAALPGALALIGGRVLTLALVPASGAVAIVLATGVSALRHGRLGGGTRVLVTATVIGLALGHLVAAPILRVVAPAAFGYLAQQQHEVAAHTPGCDGVMVLVTAADPVITTYVPATLMLRNRGPERLRVLSMAPVDHRIENITRTGFDLVAIGGDRTRTVWERLYGSRRMMAGTHVALTSLDAMVIEDRDGVPTRVRFDVGEPLDSPHLCFVWWQDGRITPVAIPGRREPILLPHYPGPMGW